MSGQRLRYSFINRGWSMHKIFASGIVVLVALLILMLPVWASVGGQSSSTARPSPQLPRTADGNAPIKFSSLATSSIVIAGRVTPGVFLEFGTAYRAEGAGG